MAFDVGNVLSCLSSCSLTGLSPGTLGGTNDYILQYGVNNNNFSACPNSATNPNVFPSGNAACGLLNSTNNAAGTFSGVAGTVQGNGSVAFKEASASTPVLNLTQNQMPDFKWNITSYALIPIILRGAGSTILYGFALLTMFSIVCANWNSVKTQLAKFKKPVKQEVSDKELARMIVAEQETARLREHVRVLRDK